MACPKVYSNMCCSLRITKPKLCSSGHFCKINGFWGERTFLDVKVFNPYAPSNRSTTPRRIYRRHENVKKRSYLGASRNTRSRTCYIHCLSLLCNRRNSRPCITVRDIKIDEAVLVRCLAYYAKKQGRNCRNRDAMALKYRDMR